MTLKRPRYPMPDFVEKALTANKLMEAYLARPPYQQNDDIGWIIQAKQEATKQKRLNQMISELKAGNKYMNMDYHPIDQR